MKRRALLALLLPFSIAVHGQSGKVHRIGMLEITPESANRANLNAFLEGLRKAGYVEGENFVIEYRSVDGQPGRFPKGAAELAAAKVDIIVTRSTAAALAAKKLGSIPVVMTSSADPVAYGVVASLARPGGNVTGLSTMVGELAAKRLRVLKQLVPQAKRVAAPLNLGNVTAAAERRQIEAAAKSLGMQAIILDVRDAEALGGALETAVQQGADALLVNAEVVVMGNRRTVIDFARKHRLPAMYAAREYVESGGLVAYGVNYPDLYSRAASYVVKILKGAKPGDLAIGKPTKMNLVINARAATELNVSIPSTLLQSVDELIR
ncbi:MAG TPA: ABC transporter substrate-binding protein [Burkholderiales bacterium]|nr:ABC transporter substrate-binding protein [Burkholderiales bacterium]